MNHEIQITDKPDGEDVQRVLSGLRQYNYSHVKSDIRDIGIFVRDEGQMIAGLYGTSFRNDFELLFSGAGRCHTKQCLRRLIKLKEDMKNITKALIGTVVLAFLLSDALASLTMIFPGESFSIICNNLLALVGIALILMAKDLTT